MATIKEIKEIARDFAKSRAYRPEPKDIKKAIQAYEIVNSELRDSLKEISHASR